MLKVIYRRYKLICRLFLISLIFVYIFIDKVRATQPLNYANMPTGSSLLQFGYGYNEIAQDPAINAYTNLGLYRYGYYFDLFGQTAGIGFFGSYNYSKFFVNNQKVHDVGGIADPTVIFACAFFGSPALSQQAFQDYALDNNLIFATYLTAPIGDYKQNQVVNLGSNRWQVKPELAYNFALSKSAQINLYANVTAYSKNDEYRNNTTLTQDVLWGLEAYYVQFLSHAFWLSIGLDYYQGGESYIDGTTKNSKQNNIIYTPSVNYYITPKNLLSLTYYKSTPNSSSQEMTVLLQWTYFFKDSL